MKQVQVTEMPAVRVNPDTAKVRMGAMTPSFPPTKDSDKSR